jgi:hypothetical protein
MLLAKIWVSNDDSEAKMFQMGFESLKINFSNFSAAFYFFEEEG